MSQPKAVATRKANDAKKAGGEVRKGAEATREAAEPPLPYTPREDRRYYR